jgi:hypothetical protein
MTRASFDALVTRLAGSYTTLSEGELLEATHWGLAEDARLRDDHRFRETPWGRWMLAEDILANDAVYAWLHAESRSSVSLESALARARELFERRCVFCGDDPRFVLRRDEVNLAASELSRLPVVEDDVGDLEKYRTHLPLHSLKAAAASAPAGEWGRRAQEQVIETLGWVRVSLAGRRLNARMFIAAIEGHSMDDGKSGLVDGGYAVFELWPSGTKQNLNVLVRGAFSDPETGSYAVKKYVADPRDEEGRHHKVSLVSLNPNKDRFPSIELQATNDDDIVVVAKVVRALSIDEYERRPRAKRRSGRRILTGDAQAARLVRRIASFFDGGVSGCDDEEMTPATGTGWQTRLVCFEVAAGGLQLEVGPLEGLPSFVKKLRAVGRDWDALALAANAKTRPTRVSVRPGSGPWRWEAVGFEQEQDLGVEKLVLDALGVTDPIVFRVDAEGVGNRIQSTTLACGQAYRLLLPPTIGSDIGTELDAGWRIWSFDLGLQPSPSTLQTLIALGLEVGEAWPRLEWALAAAAYWRTNARGESYPVFELGNELVVSVSGMVVEDGDEAVLFLQGPTGTERLKLQAGGVISLGTPSAGRWVCALMHSRTTVQPATLLFEVAESATQHVSASCTAAAPSGLASLEVTAAPGWPVAVRWRVLHEDPVVTVYGSDDQTVPLEGVKPLLEARASRTRMADVVFDYGELGRRVIPHDGRASLKQVREQLTALWLERGALVRSRPGAWLQLIPVWFEPITTLFGYGFESNALPVEAEAPHDLAAWVLTVDERIMGAITRTPSRVLVLTTELDSVLQHHRPWLDNACTVARVRDAIVTNGVCWTTYRRGAQQLTQQQWDFDQVIGLGSVDKMLSMLAEGL